MPDPKSKPLPDTMPLRDALRGLRHAVRRGGETLLDVMPVGSLPRPAAELAGAVLHEVGAFAKGVNSVASGLARVALGAGAGAQGSLQNLTLRQRVGHQSGGHQIAGHQTAEDGFAQGVYAALRAVLRHLTVQSAYISETAARTAYLALTPEQRTGSDAKVAATLSLALDEAKVLRGVSAADAARVPGQALDQIAIFAVMLWLQSNRGEAEDASALKAATDLAVALAAEADAAFRDNDAARLAALYAEFASHV